MLGEIEFAPSLKNGSFDRSSLSEMLDLAVWADTTLLAGGIGRNSQAAVALESFVAEFKGRLVITQDAVDIFLASPSSIVSRPNTLVVAAFGQLQKIWSALGRWPAITYDMDLIKLAECLHQLTLEVPAIIVTKHQSLALVAFDGKVSSTLNNDKIWRVKTAAIASVWWMQNPAKPFEGITSSLIA